MSEGSRSTLAHYGIAHATDSSKGVVLELFIPETIFKQFGLQAGSTVILQGLANDNDGEFYLRGRSGLEEPQPERSAFTASVLLPNAPKALHRFLEMAHDEDVTFQGIRTFGYRSSDRAEVVIEGTVRDRERHFVYRHNVKTVLDAIARRLASQKRPLDATIVSQEVLRFHAPPLAADIGSTIYRLEMPVLRDRFLKVRAPLEQPLRSIPLGRLVVIRLGLDLSSMTVSINPELGRKQCFLLVFKGRELAKGQPVTNTILEGLQKELNVESISAFEYLAYDKEAEDPTVLKPMGRIEMLCVADATDRLDQSKEASLRKRLERKFGGPAKVEFDITPLENEFEALREQRQRRDSSGRLAPRATAIFDESLNDRYIELGEIGGGTSAKVYRYFDLITMETVAGKRFPGQVVKPHELNALVDRSGTSPSKRLLRLRDYFYDDNTPVIVTELLPVTLANHVGCPYRNPSIPTHPYPANFSEFFEMAIHVTEGLEELHARVKETAGVRVPIGLIHGDIKPENIGAAIKDNLPVWKLIDFGLSKQYGVDKSKSTGLPVGTPGFMSYQVCKGGERGPRDDIFALGVTFFEVLCDWRHPWTPHTSEQPTEVTSGQPCDPKRWQLGARFLAQNPPAESVESLRTIVYRMMAPDKQNWISSASELRRDLVLWGRDNRKALAL